MIIIINLLLELSIVYFLLSQIVFPAFQGKILFPLFRKRLRKLKSEKSSVMYQDEVFDAESEVNDLKKEVEEKTQSKNPTNPTQPN